MRHTVTFIALSLLGGCAFHNAVRDAESLSAQGDYQGALERYQEARALRPGNDEVAREIRALRPRAFAQALDRVLELVERGDYALALQIVNDANEILPGDPRVADARRSVQDAMVAALDREVQAGVEEADYALFGKVRATFPNVDLSASSAVLRRAFFERADVQVRNGQFAGAADAVALVLRYDPCAEATLRMGKLRASWADSLVASGRAHEAAGRLGAALASYARAFEVADRPADQDAVRRLAAVVAPTGALTVNAAFSGDPARAGALRADLAAALGALGIPATRSATPLAVSISAGRSWCDQRAVAETASQAYNAGRAQVENEAWRRVWNLLQAAADRAARARALSQERGSILADAKADLGSAEQALVVAQRAQLLAAQQVSLADAAARRATTEVRDREAAIAADPKDVRVASGLADARVRLSAALAGVEAAQSAMVAADAAVDAASAERDRAQVAMTDAASAAQRADAELSAREYELNGLEAEERRVPSRVWVDVTDVFEYRVDRWTRTCSTEVDLVISVDGRSESRRFVASSSVTDTAHPAFPSYGVSEDRLRFARADAELWQAADRSGGRDTLAVVRDRADRWYDARAEAALAEARVRPDEASTAVIGLLLAGDARLSDEHRSALAAFIGRRFGIEDVAVLSS